MIRWRTGPGFLFLLFPAMLALAGLDVLLSGRDLTQAFLDLERETQAFGEATRNPILAWTQRGVSLLLIAASLERITTHFMQSRPLPSVVLTGTFLFYWFTGVLAPGLLGAHPQLTHEYGYSLLLGFAATLTMADDRERILTASRNGLFVFMLAGIVLVPWNPALVLDASYSQGLLPGVPRFGGLAAHPVSMGMLAQTALLLLWARPLQRRWLTMLCWLLGLTVLFFAQSKTAWLAFLISAACMVVVRNTADSIERLGDVRHNSFGVLMLFGVVVAVVGALLAVLVFDLPDVIADFFGTGQGAQLASLTGRDRIWTVALEEWSNNPVFGYGPTIWDSEYRNAIGMPFAVHGHNQFIDALARTGTIGTFGLVAWFVTLMVLSFRYAKATRGLSLAMFLTLALMCVSEVPLLLAGYGTDVFTHMLLVVTVAAAASERRRNVIAADLYEPVIRTAA
ncbi:O-antigen ligase family protein [Ramlibacter algicola]|uniref:O-antigen ligase family protein n=1 Tax=Ramlibacter algicola TaxID=2795217 RepID=A0A934PZ87_9BURK|nr:O-antigen ligase family protein [Ramlibacter algicola]MBK0392265.1 O-antigen ligase family protein [Ramlibacter algicola]